VVVYFAGALVAKGMDKPHKKMDVWQAAMQAGGNTSA